MTALDMYSVNHENSLAESRQSWTVKSKPEDFRVVEVLFPSKQAPSSGEHTAILVTKINLTTFQAVEVLAHHTNTSVQQWQHAGLKDEDGVTTQTIIFKGTLSFDELVGIQSRIQASLKKGQSISLEYSGLCDQSLTPGSLLGNAFSITINDVSHEEQLWIRQNQKRTISFINYYDSQRFGFPGHPKHSHTIGQLLNEEDYQRAFELYRISCPSDQQEQRSPGQSAQDFFDRFAPHRKAFYLSSWKSSVWNSTVGSLLTTVSGSHIVEHPVDELNFQFADHATILLLAESSPMLPYVGFRAKGSDIVRINGNRATTCSTNYSVIDQDQRSIRIAFFLPVGSYATMFLKQLCLLCRAELMTSL
jgi:tRNA pseudouridine13 synthase